MAAGAGFAVTTALLLLRAQFTWWVFHPVGYATANTPTMNQMWLPFFIAWIAKIVVLRYGGIRLYRQSLPFFYGVIVGDFVAGGLTTDIGCFTGIGAYRQVRHGPTGRAGQPRPLHRSALELYNCHGGATWRLWWTARSCSPSCSASLSASV